LTKILSKRRKGVEEEGSMRENTGYLKGKRFAAEKSG